MTSWDKYRQVFDAIVSSNGWDDATVTLQLLSHLDGDALNVALLVPEATRVTQIGLVGALTDHYGTPGGLADYRRQFEKTVRQDGKEPSKFAVTLETLAIKAFGDMGQNARTRKIHDQFIAGRPNSALRRHLDSMPPESPIRDIVDRCRVRESHTDFDGRRVVKPTLERAQPVYAVSEPTLWNTNTGATTPSGDSPQGLGCGIVLLLWQLRPCGKSMPDVGRKISLHVARMVGGEER